MPLRLTTALLLVLAMVAFAPCALAQSSSPAAQYQGGGSGYCPPDSICAQSLNDGADAFSENAGQGTDAVNGALKVSEASADASSAPPGSVRSAAPATAGSSSPEGGTNEEGDPEGPGKVTELPETGGAPLAALGSGMLLVTFGLTALRLAAR